MPPSAKRCGRRRVRYNGNSSLRKLCAEALDGSRFAVVSIEHGHQLGYLKDFLELRAEVSQLQSGALRAGAMEGGDQSAESRAVDIADVREIQHDFFLARREEGFYFFTERVALFTEHDPPIDIQNIHSVHNPIDHF